MPSRKDRLNNAGMDSDAGKGLVILSVIGASVVLQACAGGARAETDVTATQEETATAKAATKEVATATATAKIEVTITPETRVEDLVGQLSIQAASELGIDEEAMGGFLEASIIDSGAGAGGRYDRYDEILARFEAEGKTIIQWDIQAFGFPEEGEPQVIHPEAFVVFTFPDFQNENAWQQDVVPPLGRTDSDETLTVTPGGANTILGFNDPIVWEDLPGAPANWAENENWLEGVSLNAPVYWVVYDGWLYGVRASSFKANIVDGDFTTAFDPTLYGPNDFVSTITPKWGRFDAEGLFHQHTKNIQEVRTLRAQQLVALSATATAEAKGTAEMALTEIVINFAANPVELQAKIAEALSESDYIISITEAGTLDGSLITVPGTLTLDEHTHNVVFKLDVADEETTTVKIYAEDGVTPVTEESFITSTPTAPAATETATSTPTTPADTATAVPATETERPSDGGGGELVTNFHDMEFEMPAGLVIPEIATDQFELETNARPDGSISRVFWCVVGETHVGKVQITDDVFSLVGSICWYKQAGENKWVYVPLMLSDGEVMAINGYGVQDYEEYFEEGEREYWLSMLSQAKYEDQGHILGINADEVQPEKGVYGTSQGIGAKELSETYTEERYAEFGKTGDPEVLGGILPSHDVAFTNGPNSNKK